MMTQKCNFFSGSDSTNNYIRSSHLLFKIPLMLNQSSRVNVVLARVWSISKIRNYKLNICMCAEHWAEFSKCQKDTSL